ncbi:MAG: hypothetical protein ACK5AZ_14795 [Bryobacteraceae bacterium]
MRYRVAYLERFDKAGEGTESPPEFLEPQLSDGIVLDATFVEKTAPGTLHVQEVMDEDDSWGSIGTEIWEYDVEDSREREFVDALRNSRMVIEYQRLDDAPGGPE